MATIPLSAAEDLSRDLFARVWRSHDGLPNNEVSGISQDGSGYLWIAYRNGVAKFDGVRFQPVSLPLREDRDYRIRALLRTAGDRFWVALDGGTVLCLAPERTNRFTAADGLPLARPFTLAEGRDGAIWIGFGDGSACRIVGRKVTRYTARDGLAEEGNCRLTADNEGRIWFAQTGRVGLWRDNRFHTLLSLPVKHIRIGRARHGGVWVCADARVFHYREDGEPTERARLPLEHGYGAPDVILEDRSGMVWVGTYGDGLFRCREDGVVDAVETSQRTIFSLHEDREGSLWVGTAGGGLNRLRPRVLDLQTVESGLPFETARSLCVDGAGRVWAAARNGALAYSENGTWRLCGTNDGWAGEVATCVTSDREGAVWIGTYRAGSLYRWHQGAFARWDRTTGLAGNTVCMLLADRAGNLWVGTSSPSGLQRLTDGQLRRYPRLPPGQTIRAAVEDATGQIWLGTSDGWLLRVAGNDLIDETRQTQWPPRPISRLEATPDGSLWIGYASGGMGRLRAGRFYNIGPEHGLPAGRVCDMVAGSHNSLWLATDQGILRVAQDALDAVADHRTSQLNAIYYGSDELMSVQGLVGYSPGATRTPTGDILFPVLTGLAVVHPNRVSTNRHPPQVVIEAASANDQPLALSRDGRPLRLRPGLRKLEFQFTAPSFIAPASIRFRHQLEGVDDSWVELGTQRRVTYTRLPPGRYAFRVTACDFAGLWNEVGDRVAFEVRPFFWQTLAFKLSGVVLCLLGLAGAVRYVSTRRLRQEVRRLQQEAALHHERARIAKDIHDDLGANLTQISLLSELAARHLRPTDTGGEHVKKLALTARQAFTSLDEIVWAVNPRNDTLAHLLDYLAQFALDFLASTPLRCRIDFPTQPPAHAVSSDVRHTLYLVTKEALNNVVKHARAAEVQLRAALVEHTLHLTISDDGVGFDPSCTRPEADGLLNMRQRLEAIGGRFTIASQPHRGTTITAEIPLAVRQTPAT